MHRVAAARYGAEFDQVLRGLLAELGLPPESEVSFPNLRCSILHSHSPTTARLHTLVRRDTDDLVPQAVPQCVTLAHGEDGGAYASFLLELLQHCKRDSDR